MTVQQILTTLEAMGLAANRELYAKHGIASPAYGIAFGHLRALAKQIGTDTAKASASRARRSATYRAERQRLAPFEELARLVIKHRSALALSQAELARRMGTSHSAVSRIESGRHKTSVDTLQRLAHALGLRLVLGFESGPPERPIRELVSA